MSRADTRKPAAFYVLGLLRLGMVLLICSVYDKYAVTEAQQLFVFGGAAVFIIDHVLMTRSKRYYKWLVGTDFLTASLFGVVFVHNDAPYPLFYGIISVSLMMEYESKAVLRVFAAALAVVWGLLIGHEHAVLGVVDVYSVVIDAGFVAFASLVGFLIRFYQDARLKIAELYDELGSSHEALQEAHDQLRGYAQQVETMTAVRERNHIAREIHDTVGHTMTALLVQLQAARKLQERDLDKSRETLVRCEDLARSALQEVRLSVRAIREEEAASLSLVEQLRTLLAEFSEMTGMKTSLQVHGSPGVVPLSLVPTMYRLVQESLTNAKRHGNATAATVDLICSEALVGLEVADNGQGSGDLQPGFGMINMRERAAEQGGTIHFSSDRGGGFRVTARFPLQQQTWRYGGTTA